MTTPEPSTADLVSDLMNRCRVASLATQMSGVDSSPRPYVSLVTVARVGETSIAMLLSGLAKHTQNLAKCPAVSLLLCDQTSPDADPMAAERVTLMGQVVRLPHEDDMNVRDAFLQKHPNSRMVAGFGDFFFHLMHIEECHVIAGFGRIETLPSSSLRV
ncbi:PNPOx family protein [Rhodopirellula bahusiensis]|uniref:Pyridoxamine 5-phosphate oxidase n=1 Tax=Rhodopirellula bahusiensis TaxID=2014065 RepID=A0A2G1W3G6_9BACT|nr:pyridoxamine 5'-phosphate oxidase family protein [Rhodopirellula bahusiensis]PHQ33572.1 pyridoxamine 5-phosphate oxidase [Rhodopirellula bahusiensis]